MQGSSHPNIAKDSIPDRKIGSGWLIKRPHPQLLNSANTFCLQSFNVKRQYEQMIDQFKVKPTDVLTICTEVHELMYCSETFSAVPWNGQWKIEEFPQWQLGLHFLLNLNWVKNILVLMKKSNMTEDINSKLPSALYIWKRQNMIPALSLFGNGGNHSNWGRQILGFLLKVKKASSHFTRGA